MIWLLLALAAAVGMIRGRRDLHALELATLAAVLAVCLFVSSLLVVRPEAATSASRALTLLGGARGSEPVPYFFPAAHVAYPVMLAHAMSPLGKLGATLALVLLLACVVTTLGAGHCGWDVAAGLAFGELVSRATSLGAPDGRDGTTRRAENPALVIGESAPTGRARLRAQGMA